MSLIEDVRRNLREFALLGGLGAAVTALPLLGTLVALWFVPDLEVWLRQHAQAPLVMAAACVFLGGCALLPTQVMALFAGWCLGLWGGFWAVFVGTIGAALLGHGIGTKLARGAFDRWLDRDMRARAVHAALIREPGRAAWLVFLLRLSPLAPFALVNLLAAGAGVRLGSFLLGSIPGAIPRTLAATATGAALTTFDPRADGGATWWPWFGAGATVLLAVYLTIIARRALVDMSGAPPRP